MAIVHVGNVSLRVRCSESRREFVEALLADIKHRVKEVVVRCVEESLEGEATKLFGRGWYEQRQPPGRETAARCSRCSSTHRPALRPPFTNCSPDVPPAVMPTLHYAPGTSTWSAHLHPSTRFPQGAIHCRGRASPV